MNKYNDHAVDDRNEFQWCLILRDRKKKRLCVHVLVVAVLGHLLRTYRKTGFTDSSKYEFLQSNIEYCRDAYVEVTQFEVMSKDLVNLGDNTAFEFCS